MPWVTIAISGTAWSTLDNTLTARAAPLASYEQTVVVLVGGTSDLIEGDTAATALADLESYVATYRTLGADRIIGTTVTPSSLFNAGMETQRVALNTATLASDVFDDVVDLAAIPELADNLDTDYYYDGTHWTAAGAQFAADAVAAALGGP